MLSFKEEGKNICLLLYQGGQCGGLCDTSKYAAKRHDKQTILPNAYQQNFSRNGWVVSLRRQELHKLFFQFIAVLTAKCQEAKEAPSSRWRVDLGSAACMRTSERVSL
jgi:hypothetical protein